MSGWAIGIDVGGTKIAAAVVTPTGEIREQLQVPTQAANGPEALISRLAELAIALHARYPGVSAVGVGSAGQIDHRMGIVTYANENLPGWTGMPIAARLAAALGLPIYVENDVRAMALAEAVWGAGKGSRVLLAATIGTGVGGALVLDGEVFRGAGGGAGELGHIPVTAGGPRCGCGRRGCLEAYAAGPRIAAAYARAVGRRPVDLEAVATAAAAGDALAIAAFDRAGRLLGRVLAGLANVLDPDCLVIGGGGAAAGEVLLAPMRSSMAAHLLPPVAARMAVLPVALGESAGVLGAAYVALRHL